MRVDDAQGLLLQGDALLVEQDAALIGPGGHEADGGWHTRKGQLGGDLKAAEIMNGGGNTCLEVKAHVPYR